MAKRAKGGAGGRPPSGPEGERVSEYPKLTVRIPPDTKRKLLALSAMRGEQAWKLVDEAVRAYIDGLPADERRLLSQIAARVR